jgi:TorA maturation chaperone TorD
VSQMRRWLDQAAVWRTASLLLQPPSAESLDELRSLIAELPEGDRRLLLELPGDTLDEMETDYHQVLGPAGLPACESSYDTSAMAGRGPLLALVSGYYQAFAYRPDVENLETPDHASVELGFLSYLALKIAFAMHQNRADEQAIAESAYWKFMDEHPRYWMSAFCEKMAHSGSVFYGAVAGWILRALEYATESDSTERLPANNTNLCE